MSPECHWRQLKEAFGPMSGCASLRVICQSNYGIVHSRRNMIIKWFCPTPTLPKTDHNAAQYIQMSYPLSILRLTVM